MAAAGKVAPIILGMLKCSPVLPFPKDDSVADLSRHEALPVAFALISQAWHQFH